MGDSFDSTKSGNYTTTVENVLVFTINWNKVKTFEDFLLLAKNGLIKSEVRTEDSLNGADLEIKKYFKTDGTKIQKVKVNNQQENV